jgi:hypothetical protein
MLLEKFTCDGNRIEPYRLRISANEGAPEDARRPARHIIALERLEESQTDLRVGGNRGQRDLPPFPFSAQPCA